MNRDRTSQRKPVILSLIFGLMLTIMPLPGAAESFRPDWLALLVIFWTMQLPRTWSVGTAWIIGIVLDVSQGTLLGQHALTLCVVAFVTVRFHLLMRVFPLPQMTATVLPLLALYQFLLFWINGVAGIDAPSVTYWGPVISGTLVWPVVMMFLSGMRYRTQG
ncbi:MAG: rod shape-determining protein MreD [Proteobacteria bacterium]|nr:rod shape-determining protein MreD [Pseudomonadota bacterium]